MTSIRSSLANCFLLTLLTAAPADAAILTVNSSADDGTGTCTVSKCTLRDAVLSAAVNDTISFALPPKSTITLTRGELFLNKSMTIEGPGSNLLKVARSSAPGTPEFRIFQIAFINFSVVVTISGLTISNGRASGERGGGIFNTGTLTVTDCEISGNVSTLGGLNGNGGGGIYNQIFGVLTVINSTISGNAAINGGHGGGISNWATMTVVNSTVSGNMATNGTGGGIWTIPATIINSTITGNLAETAGGLYANGPPTLRNTIIARNPSDGPDVTNSINSQGFNLVGNARNAIYTPATGDQFGTVSAPINPMLGPLQDNGGPTFTHALLPGSPAIDKGNAGGMTTDQRGFVRPVDSPGIANTAGGDGSDIGAYEAQADRLPGCGNTIVTNNNDSGTGSLRTMIANICAGETITFAPNVTGAINLTSGELLIGKNLTINGPGANVLTVQRSVSAGNFRIFNVTSPNTSVALSGLTIANGMTSGSGGGISNVATLRLVDTAISGNSALNGGGIFNDFGTLTIIGSTLSGNTVSNSVFTGSGGGLFNRGGTVSITNSTISGNSAIFPNGISDSGGGIITNVGSVTIANSTIAGNSADIGGGIRNVNGGIVKASNSIIALNASPNGPDVNGSLTSQGYNLIGTGAAAMISSTNGDQIGSAAALIDPMLGPLQDNGGSTLTRALLVGSTAIDRGHSGGATTDQRGFKRPLGVANVRAGDGSDIGAFEVQVPVLVVEFYNASLDHYFITWVVDEIAKLDAGTVIKGWTRTGQAFMTYASPQPGTSPVCRYYIPPGLGDSHFFGRGSDECNATGEKNPSFVLEATGFMQMFLPVGGNCPTGTLQVYRVFSNRLDANHRYMTEKTTRDQMATAGWLVEGDGPDAVVMCAPQ